jgi:hypothetical protein
MHYEFIKAPMGQALPCKDLNFANLLVITGDAGTVKDFTNRWCPDGWLLAASPERSRSGRVEELDEEAVGRSEVVYSCATSVGIYFENFGGAALCLCAEIADTFPNVVGMLLASDHVAAEGIVGKLNMGEFAYMSVPPSSRVDSISYLRSSGIDAARSGVFTLEPIGRRDMGLRLVQDRGSQAARVVVDRSMGLL